MTVWVFDATPLIYLGKIRVLDKLTHTTNLIPRSVYKEVVEHGKDNQEALTIKQLVDKVIFRVVDVKQTFPHNSRLDDADLDVIAHAKDKKCTAIVDDRAARIMGEFLHVHTAGSLHVLFTLLQRKIMTSKEVKQAVDAMIDHGWYCSTDLYSKILQKLETFK